MTIVIKRYSNRKLYDTSARRYIALDGIANLIRKGSTVQIIDNVTEEDLTAVTLMQIIMDQEKKQAGFLPGAFLVEMIKSGGNTWSEVRHALTLALPDFSFSIDKNISKYLSDHGIPTRDDLEKLKVQLELLDEKIASLRD
jgi:polyhydroxyalkanoate synthesis repressor PhaR